MGAWGYGIFDDDTAYDFTDEIKSNAKLFFKTSFESAIKTKYLGFDECHMVTISCAYLDNFLNGTEYRTDSGEEKDESNVNLFKNLYKGESLDDLKLIGIKALEKVISKNSDLNQLWSECEEDYPNWKESIKELINRLK